MRLQQRVLSCTAAALISMTSQSSLGALRVPSANIQVVPPALAVTEPSAEAQVALRKAFTAAQAGLSSADSLLSGSIAEWESTRQPAEEIASLYKTRGGVRLEQGQQAGALEDFSKSLELLKAAGSKANLAEEQRTYQLRARANDALGNRKQLLDDLSSAINLLDELDVIESTNPYLYAQRAKARMALGDFRGAADDAEVAAVQFKDTGDKIRRVLAIADGALARYGSGEIADGVEDMRTVFRTKRTLATTNPDDIALLQELSKKDAELHVAYSAYLYSQGRTTEAARQWESGCVRLDTCASAATPAMLSCSRRACMRVRAHACAPPLARLSMLPSDVVDGKQRYEEEIKLRELETAKSDATGKAEVLKAASVDSPLGGLAALSPFRTSDFDPQSPSNTQRAGRAYIWYKTSEGEVERRDAGNPLQSRDGDIAIGLSCTAFQDPAWVAKYRPEWPKNLAQQVQVYAAEVRQPNIPLPPKGAPPTRGELEF